jgi:predicted MFS family arabinose efflux permease
MKQAHAEVLLQGRQTTRCDHRGDAKSTCGSCEASDQSSINQDGNGGSIHYIEFRYVGLSFGNTTSETDTDLDIVVIPFARFSMSELATPSVQTVSKPFGRSLTFVMAAATGVAVANIYYNQPMLGVIQAEFPGQSATGLIPTATQIGYAAGLFLLVPLGDMMDRRRLIVGQFALLAAALVLAALAPTGWALVAASLLVGATSTVAQQIIPFAALLASPERRGQTVGTIMSGLLCGLLFSRTLAGFVATHAGWREMFWVGSPVAIIAGLTMAIALPRSHPYVAMPYSSALRSMIHLWRNEPSLRSATVVQAALFASFTVFWTILALHLQEPRFALGADIAGLFGIVGAVGIFAAPLAGRLADQRGPARVALIGAAITCVSWIIFGFWGRVIGLVVGVVILDVGVTSALISNQHIVFGLHPEARGRLNTIFMTGMFLGGSVGSAGATFFWSQGGWGAVSIFGAGLAVVAAVLQGFSHRRTINSDLGG